MPGRNRCAARFGPNDGRCVVYSTDTYTELDLSRAENVKRTAGKITFRCPACAEQGADRAGNHGVIMASGKWGCVAHAGDVEHRRRMAELLGESTLPRLAVPAPLPPRRGAPQFPSDLRAPTIGEHSTIQIQRGFPTFAGLEIASRAGHLFTGTFIDGGEPVRAWVITDSSRRNAQARRLDGKLWHGIGAKAKTLRGSEASWPVGAADIADRKTVLLCEGGPDFLTGYLLAWWHGMHHEVAPVAMLGAGQRIHAEALPYFIGKRVLILPHTDPAGEKARAVWTEQLRAHAASIDTYRVAPHKDINDAVAAYAREMGDDT
jgi:hypothetical protein